MKTRIFLIVCLLFVKSPLYAQFKVSIQYDCLEYNSALLDKCMIEVFGEEFVSQWLEDEKNIIYLNIQDSTCISHRGFGFRCDINKDGDVTDLKPLIHRKCSLSELQLEQLKQYIIESKVRFYFCYEYDGWISINRAYNLAYEGQKKYFEEHATALSTIYFPGLRYRDFIDEKLSKYESLCKYIDYYLKDLCF